MTYPRFDSPVTVQQAYAEGFKLATEKLGLAPIPWHLAIPAAAGAGVGAWGGYELSDKRPLTGSLVGGALGAAAGAGMGYGAGPLKGLGDKWKLQDAIRKAKDGAVEEALAQKARESLRSSAPVSAPDPAKVELAERLRQAGKQQQQPTLTVDPQESPLIREFEAAVASGDDQTLKSVIDRLLNTKLQDVLRNS